MVNMWGVEHGRATSVIPDISHRESILIVAPSRLEFGKHGKPEFRAFGIVGPESQPFLFPLQCVASGQIYCPGVHKAFQPPGDEQVIERPEERDRIQRVTRLCSEFIQYRINDVRYQRG